MAVKDVSALCGVLEVGVACNRGHLYLVFMRVMGVNDSQ